MTNRKKKGKEVVLVGCLYEKQSKCKKNYSKKSSKTDTSKVEMGKFLLSIPKDLRREIKFESDEKGYSNTSEYICYILKRRHNLI